MESRTVSSEGQREQKTSQKSSQEAAAGRGQHFFPNLRSRGTCSRTRGMEPEKQAVHPACSVRALTVSTVNQPSPALPPQAKELHVAATAKSPGQLHYRPDDPAGLGQESPLLPPQSLSSSWQRSGQSRRHR